MKTPNAIIICMIAFILEFKAQHYTHDLGVFVGSTSLQSDYGERGDFSSQFNNNSTSFAVAHYLHFFNRTLRWDPNNILRNHLMVKSEIHYISSAQLEHHGKWANGKSDLAERLRAMKGSLRVLNVGTNIEYFLHPLEEFVYPYSYMLFNPFVTFGVRYSFYNTGLSSELGDWQKDRTLLPKKFSTDEALHLGSSQSISLTASIGTRIKIAPKIDVVTQFGYQYFFSDNIDGLNANVAENQNKDWLMNIQFGLVYHLNFSTPLFY